MNFTECNKVAILKYEVDGAISENKIFFSSSTRGMSDILSDFAHILAGVEQEISSYCGQITIRDLKIKPVTIKIG